MSFENEENKGRRERFVTCSEETLEEMENYVDNKFIRIGLKEKKMNFSFNMDGLNSGTPDIPEDVVFPSDGDQEIPHQEVPEKELEKEEDEENEKTVKTDNNINGTEGCPIGSNNEPFSETSPCGVCGQDLGKRYKGRSVFCMGCQHWCHLLRCSGLTSEK